MKAEERGPFSRILWFCADGEKLPPKAYACVPHGGGVQHGEYNERVRTLRANGYFVANVLAGLDPEAFLRLKDAPDRFKQILIEQFLIGRDDGWILRRARFYRGALQEEDERVAARKLLLRLAGSSDWLTRNFVVMRAGAHFLNHGNDSQSISEIRQRAADLSKRDAAFSTIRNKIHLQPDTGDIERVRNYARQLSDPELTREYIELARLMEQVYSPLTLSAQMQTLADLSRGHPLLKKVIGDATTRLTASQDVEYHFRETARLMAKLRDMLSGPYESELRLALIDTSLSLESAHFIAATELEKQLPSINRQKGIQWLRLGIQAAYGTGLLSKRQYQALSESLSRLSGQNLGLATYKQELDYLALVPAWADRQLKLHFHEPVQRLAAIEPLAGLFSQDILRSGPLFFYTRVLDRLLRDANRLTGMHKTLFGKEVGSGIRALNPGIAKGVLHLAPAEQEQGYSADGIYLLPETTSRLPPVAGIITVGEGNLLSHVQLLARNLGIPNVVVDNSLVPRLEQVAGKTVQLAVSPAGSVQLRNIAPDKQPLTQLPKNGIQIYPDLKKLNLEQRDLIRLSDLHASDSGRVVGPKAAMLGELQHHYPESVANGLAIPFGVFRSMLDRPYRNSGMSMFEWMRSNYRQLEKLPEDSPQRTSAAEDLRRRIHGWILNNDLEPAFHEHLREAMASVFGIDGTYGVFVRSDTNIEDLPGFNGAGLNLTVPNVVGFEQILDAIPKVWASPFSRRAFAWRQGRMSLPEHVYPAVLLMRTVPVNKSGVMITRDVDSGDPNWLSVAVNEGVGGVVDGQAAESLRINLRTGEVRLMAQATMPWKWAVNPHGGIERIPASGSDQVLEPSEIQQLLKLARGLPQRYPPITDDQGKPTAADIEFGFINGDLVLFQIRPFLENRAARNSAYLKALDAGIRDYSEVMVDMTLPPKVSP